MLVSYHPQCPTELPVFTNFTQNPLSHNIRTHPQYVWRDGEVCTTAEHRDCKLPPFIFFALVQRTERSTYLEASSKLSTRSGTSSSSSSSAFAPGGGLPVRTSVERLILGGRWWSGGCRSGV